MAGNTRAIAKIKKDIANLETKLSSLQEKVRKTWHLLRCVVDARAKDGDPVTLELRSAMASAEATKTHFIPSAYLNYSGEVFTFVQDHINATFDRENLYHQLHRSKGLLSHAEENLKRRSEEFEQAKSHHQNAAEYLCIACAEEALHKCTANSLSSPSRAVLSERRRYTVNGVAFFNVDDACRAFLEANKRSCHTVEDAAPMLTCTPPSGAASSSGEASSEGEQLPHGPRELL